MRIATKPYTKRACSPSMYTGGVQSLEVGGLVAGPNESFAAVDANRSFVAANPNGSTVVAELSRKEIKKDSD